MKLWAFTGRNQNKLAGTCWTSATSMMTSSNRNIFALLAICAGNSPVTREFPAQRPVTRSFDIFFDLRMNNSWVNNGEAGDLRRHRAHYDVIVMKNALRFTGTLWGGFSRKWLISNKKQSSCSWFETPRSSCDVTLMRFVVFCFVTSSWPVVNTVAWHERCGALNHQQLHCLFKRLFRLTTRETPKLRIIVRFMRESTGNLWFHLQKTSNSERVVKLWRLHNMKSHSRGSLDTQRVGIVKNQVCFGTRPVNCLT